MDEAIKALEEFEAAAQKLNAVWGQHLGGPVDAKLGAHYPVAWSSFDEEAYDLAEWLRKTKEAENG